MLDPCEQSIQSVENKCLVNQLSQTVLLLSHMLMTYQEEIEGLKEKLTQQLLERYGKKSEKTPPEKLPQLDEPAVLSEQEVADIEAAEAEIAAGKAEQKKHQSQPKRNPLPSELPREKVVLEVPEEARICNECQGPLHCLGEDISERLEIIPAQIKVIQLIRKKYGCRCCEIGVNIANMLPTMLPKSLAGPGLLSHIILSKYEDHCPLYRQERIWQRIGVDLPRSTLCHWVLTVAEKLAVLIPLMQQTLLDSHYARADETPVQVLEDNHLCTSKKAFMWVFTTSHPARPIIVYHFAMSRGSEVAETFFKGFTGFLQSDAYSGYDKLGQQKDITAVGCWAHVRRKFVAIVKTVSKQGEAHYAVMLIQKLYKIEKDIQAKELDFAQTQVYRQTHAKPLVTAFKGWLEEKKPKVPPKSKLGEAIGYALNHWETLIVYLAQGHLDIDNNFTERCVRPFAVGRKNWLFMGNERGGKAACVLLSLIETAKASGLNTYDYFRYLLTEFPKINPSDEEALKGLLPNQVNPDSLKFYINSG